ncbi:sigma 54-interacting transcriptional regulator [Chitinimonas lacunae]|uniref:Sigma 54-interacting transcriptional regulator n=1 Tax=Chitinimonas lacunae TaxID=1963018 RepID=A0ABV8MSJ7_9NEIS
MSDADKTLTSPIDTALQRGPKAVGLTLLWHPELDRIGEQAIGPNSAGELALHRYAPLFFAPGAAEGQPLAAQTISRSALQLCRHPDDSLTLRPGSGRMRVEVDGQAIDEEITLSRERLYRGVVVGLGGTVLLCLHWLTTLPRPNMLGGLVGVSSAMVALRDLIQQVAATEMPVLLLGETGCGKELVARAIHDTSRRAGAPLVAVNMAALGESLAAAELFGATRGAYTGAQTARQGLFAEAGAGTLFLDEIGDTPPSVQPMLLRVLETGEYRPLGASRSEVTRARLIAATDRDLGPGNFNQPLLRRLEALVIRLAPLRQRREDIGLLLAHLLPEPKARHAASLPWSFLTELCCYDWPGNVRQLGHIVRQAVMQCERGGIPELAELTGEAQPLPVPSEAIAATPSAPGSNRPSRPQRLPPSELSEQQVIDALDRSGWCIQTAAKELAISRPTLYALIGRNSRIRDPEGLSQQELAQALADSGQRVEDCARSLQVPREALRRRLRHLGLIT